MLYSNIMRLRARLFAVVFFVTTFVAAFAQDSVSHYEDQNNSRITATITGYPATPVKKVSGTNESYSVSVSIGTAGAPLLLTDWTNAWLTDVKIKMNGAEIHSWSSTTDTVTSKSFTVKWDTTNFGHGTTVPIEVEATMHGQRRVPRSNYPRGELPYTVAGEGNKTTTATVSVSIYNYGWAGDIAEIATSWNTRQYALSAYGNMLHYADESKVNNQPDVSQATAEDGLRKATVFHFGGHGEVDQNGYSTDGWGAAAWRLYPSNVTAQRQWAVQNSYPALRFAFLNTCKNGQANLGAGNDSSTAFLYPTGTGAIVDRAFLGWDITIESGWAKKFSEGFWAEMPIGATVQKARQKAWESVVQAYSWDPTFLLTVDVWQSVTRVWGDSTCRLHGLYTGTNGYNTAWYEVQ